VAKHGVRQTDGSIKPIEESIIDYENGFVMVQYIDRGEVEIVEKNLLTQMKEEDQPKPQDHTNS
jgi:hypothetical protein